MKIFDSDKFILVIAASGSLRTLIRTRLEPANLSILFAANGPEAVALLWNIPSPALILIESEMSFLFPFFEAIRLIQNRQRGSKIQIVRRAHEDGRLILENYLDQSANCMDLLPSVRQTLNEF